MNKKLLISTLVAAVLSSASMAADPTVNGTTVSQARIDAVAAMMQAQGQGQAEEGAAKPQDQARDQLITAEVLRQEAVRKGLDKQPDVRIELENLQAMTLARHLIQDYQKANPVTESELKAEYDKLKAQMPVKKSYHAEHILVKTEAEARAIIVSLKKGRPFERLAREKSLDTGSKANGGDLGWNDPESFVPEFSQHIRHALVCFGMARFRAQCRFVVLASRRQLAGSDGVDRQSVARDQLRRVGRVAARDRVGMVLAEKLRERIPPLVRLRRHPEIAVPFARRQSIPGRGRP